LCSIHETRPFDCRFFPFDIIKIEGKYYWVIWVTGCLITKNHRDDFEEYLKENEENLIPKFIDFIDDYANFRVDEFKGKFDFEILRKIKFNKNIESIIR